MSAQRIRRVANLKEMEQVIDDYITQGYKVKSRGEATATVKNGSYGNVVIHIVLLCFTFGVGNIVYALVANSNSDSVLIRNEGAASPPSAQFAPATFSAAPSPAGAMTPAPTPVTTAARPPAPSSGRMVKCPKCAAVVAVAAGQKPVCSSCGFGS